MSVALGQGIDDYSLYVVSPTPRVSKDLGFPLRAGLDECRHATFGYLWQGCRAVKTLTLDTVSWQCHLAKRRDQHRIQVLAVSPKRDWYTPNLHWSGCSGLIFKLVLLMLQLTTGGSGRPSLCTDSLWETAQRGSWLETEPELLCGPGLVWWGKCKCPHDHCQVALILALPYVVTPPIISNTFQTQLPDSRRRQCCL